MNKYCLMWNTRVFVFTVRFLSILFMQLDSMYVEEKLFIRAFYTVFNIFFKSFSSNCNLET